MKKLKHEEDETLPDVLRGMKGSNPFKIPHNYFRELPDQIMSRISREDIQVDDSPRWINLIERWKIWLHPGPVWALVAIVLAAGIFLFRNPQPVMMPVDAIISDAITSVEIAEYVRHHIDDFEESDFYINDPESLDILGDTFQSGDIDPILKDLMDQIDIETLQRIL